MTIGNRIAYALNTSGKKPADLAKYLETKQSTISGWLHDGKTPAADRIVRICEFLGVSIQWLLTGEDTQTPEALKDVKIAFYGEVFHGLNESQIEMLIDMARIMKSKNKVE